MDNFDDLKNIREIKEAKEREKNEKLLQEQSKKAEHQKASRQKQEEVRQQLTELVVSVLEDFRDAVYPNAKIIEWSIGEYRDSRSEANLDPVWHSFIFVQVNFDKEDRPVDFICSNGNTKISANISKEGLVAALKKLYPSPSVKNSREFELNGEGCIKSFFISLLASIGTLPLFGWVGFGIGSFLFTALTKEHNIFIGGLLFIGFFWAILWVIIYFIFYRK